MAKEAKHANISLGMNDHGYYANYECPGRCKFSRFYVEPPDEDDLCIYVEYSECKNHLCHIATLEKVMKSIMSDMEEMRGNCNDE